MHPLLPAQTSLQEAPKPLSSTFNNYKVTEYSIQSPIHTLSLTGWVGQGEQQLSVSAAVAPTTLTHTH